MPPARTLVQLAWLYNKSVNFLLTGNDAIGAATRDELETIRQAKQTAALGELGSNIPDRKKPKRRAADK